MSEEPIIIAGGGIGGTAAALALAHQGRTVHLLEQSSEFEEIGAGIQLGPNVYRMFKTLGLIDEIDATAVRPEALVMRDALDGRIITRVPLNDADFNAIFPYPYAVTYRPDQHNALLYACRAEPLVKLSFGNKVTDFRVNGKTVAELLDDGAQSQSQAFILNDMWCEWKKLAVKRKVEEIAGKTVAINDPWNENEEEVAVPFG